MEMTSRCRVDHVGEDVLQNIITRLPATSFASAACVSRSWCHVSNRVLSRPKLSSACSFNPCLQVAVEEVVGKVLSGPIRPHFAIASVGPAFDIDEAHALITSKLSSHVPLVSSTSSGIIGRDALSGELKETQWEVTEDDPHTPIVLSKSASTSTAIMLIVGFLPGMKVKTVPLLKKTETVMMDKFVTDISEFSACVSGRESPAAILLFSDFKTCMQVVVEKLDYELSPETVIVGDSGYQFRHTNGVNEEHASAAAVALVFSPSRNKPHGIGETRFHSVFLSGMSPVGPTYKATTVTGLQRVRRGHGDLLSRVTAKREGMDVDLNGEDILNQVYDALGVDVDDEFEVPTLYIGVLKKRERAATDQEKVDYTSLIGFHEVCGSLTDDPLHVRDVGIRSGDTFRFYHPESAAAITSATTVSNHLRSFSQEVFGGLIFSSARRTESFFGQPNTDSLQLLDNFPGATLGGIYCDEVIGRCDMTTGEESEEQKSVSRCCLHPFSGVYLIMSYTS